MMIWEDQRDGNVSEYHEFDTVIMSVIHISWVLSENVWVQESQNILWGTGQRFEIMKLGQRKL